MESANTNAPIVTSGKREAAGGVIGVSRCGGNPVCHDGRKVSKQSSEEMFRISASGGKRERATPHLLVKPGCWLTVRLGITQSRIANARQLVSECAGCFIVI